MFKSSFYLMKGKNTSHAGSFVPPVAVRVKLRVRVRVSVRFRGSDRVAPRV